MHLFSINMSLHAHTYLLAKLSPFHDFSVHQLIVFFSKRFLSRTCTWKYIGFPNNHGPFIFFRNIFFLPEDQNNGTQLAVASLRWLRERFMIGWFIDSFIHSFFDSLIDVLRPILSSSVKLLLEIVRMSNCASLKKRASRTEYWVNWSTKLYQQIYLNT